MGNIYIFKSISISISILIHKRLCLFSYINGIGSGTAQPISMGFSLADISFFQDENRPCQITL